MARTFRGERKKSSAPAYKPALRSKSRKRGPSRVADRGRSRWKSTVWLIAEGLLLAVAGLIGTISVMGQAAEWFGGSDLTQSLLPFAGTVLILAISGSMLIGSWVRLRGRWVRSSPVAAPLIAGVIALGAFVFALRPGFRGDLQNLRTLVGGVQEAGKSSIGHQVYAAYRRADLAEMQTILERSRPYLPAIGAAARTYDVDEEVMVGLGVAESSFVPRDSRDGGRGVFQITSTPRAALDAVKRQLHVSHPDPRNPQHNAHLAAATLRHYLDDMQGDLFLALLAYNIGPRNGGLRSIMQHYGARDFFTIQPYLQHLPRAYPIRVLSAALAYRLWSRDGVLPHYEDGENARYIQSMGIPGLDW